MTAPTDESPSFSVNSVADLAFILTLHGPYLWRGQANATWGLHSAAYRRITLTNKSAGEGDIEYYEWRLLEQANHRGYGFVNGRKLADLELLALLQHSGAATRLLDATRNILVALWFACAEDDTVDGCVFGIPVNALEGRHRLIRQDDYRTIMNFEYSSEVPHTILPPDVSPRVAAQHSQFIYSKICQNKHGSLAIGQNANLVKIVISREVKSDFLTLLDRVFDISRSTLFPDLDGFGQSHTGRHEWVDFAFARSRVSKPT